MIGFKAQRKRLLVTHPLKAGRMGGWNQLDFQVLQWGALSGVPGNRRKHCKRSL